MRLIDGTELRHAARALLRSPTFFAISAGSLALGIAMSVTMFGVLDALVRPSVPVRDIDQLYTVQWVTPRGSGLRRADFDAAYARVPAIAGTTWIDGMGGGDGHGEEGSSADLSLMNAVPVSAPGARLARGQVSNASANSLAILDVRLRFGRIFTTAADASLQGREAVISDGLWRDLYGSRRDFAPFTLFVGPKTFTVVGVAEPRLERVMSGHIWVAGAPQDSPSLVMRAAPGVSEAALAAALTTVSDALATRAGIAPRDAAFKLRPFGSAAMSFPALALALTVGALAVLLIACVNIANLQLARGLARVRDLAIRVAVGASRAQVIRLQVSESLLVAIVGGVGGLLLSVWLTSIVRASMPTEFVLFGLIEPQFSWRVGAGALALTALAAVAFGLVPAFRVSRLDVNALLQTGAGTGVTRTSRRQYTALVAVEVGAAMALTICAALLGTSMRAILTLDYGYTATNVIRVTDRPQDDFVVVMDIPTYNDTSHAIEAAGMRSRSLRSLAGVANATFMIPASFDSGKVTTDDPEVSRASHLMGVRNGPRIVDAEFFRTFGVAVRGPGFNAGDDGSTPTAVIDSVAAATLFGDGDPIGRMIKLGPARSPVPWVRVVGVAHHVRWSSPFDVTTSAMDPQIYLLDRHGVAPAHRSGEAMWFVRPVRDVESVWAAVHERAPAAYLALFDESTLRRMLDRMITFIAGLFTAFAAVGLALAMIGVYGVLAHSVSQRRREFGVRIAFGATTRDLVRLVLMQANVPVLAGLAVGLLAAQAGETVIGYFIRAFVSESQIAVYVIAPLAIFAATLLAGLSPALRASRTSATEAIRGI